MFVSEIYDEISEILATTDSNRIYRKLSQAVQGLMDSGHYHHLISQVDVCTGWDGMSVTLPRGIEVPLAVNTDGSPLYFRSRLFQYHINKGGMYSPVSWAWDDRGFVPVVMDILQPSQLIAIAEHESDVGVRLRVIGYDGNNRALRTQTEAGEGVDGLYVTAHAISDFPLGLIQPDSVNILLRSAKTKPLYEFTAQSGSHNFVAGTLAKVTFSTTTPKPLNNNGNYYIGTPSASTVTLHQSQLDAENGINGIQITDLRNNLNANVLGDFENTRSVQVSTALYLPAATAFGSIFPKIQTGTEVRFEKISNLELPAPLATETVYFARILDDAYNIVVYKTSSDASNDINRILLSGSKNNSTIVVRNPIAPETTLEFTLDAPFSTGDLVQAYSAGGSLPEPLLSGQNYYARRIDGKNVTLHESYEASLSGEKPIVFTTTGSGQNSVAKLIPAQSSAGKVSNISASGISISPATGQGAEITAVATGPVTFASIVSGGGGYTSVPAVKFDDIGGIGYTGAPIVQIESPNDPTGTQATAEAIMKTDPATGLQYVGFVKVTNGGTKYSATSLPTVKFIGNATFHARARAVVQGQSVTRIDLYGYGTGAAAIASVNTVLESRPVNAITLTSGGSGYRYTPRIEIEQSAFPRYIFASSPTAAGAILNFRAVLRESSANVELIASQITYVNAETTSSLAQKVVNAINNNTSTSGFTAQTVSFGSYSGVSVSNTSGKVIQTFDVVYSNATTAPKAANVGCVAEMPITIQAPPSVDSIKVTGNIGSGGVVSGINTTPEGFSVSKLKVGMGVSGTGIATNATISAVTSTTFTITPAPTAGNNIEITISLGIISSLLASGNTTDLLGNVNLYFKASDSTNALAALISAGITAFSASTGYYASATDNKIFILNAQNAPITSLVLTASPALTYDTIFPSSFAYAKCSITTNFISEYEITNAGSGYTNAPALLVAGTTGSGASASAVVDSATGKITAVDVITQGTGYTTIPAVAVSPSTGTFVQFSSTGTLPSPLIQGVTYRAEAPFDSSGTFTVKNLDFSDVNITSSATGEFNVVISRTFGIGFTNNWIGDFSWVRQGMTTYFDTDYSFPKTLVTDANTSPDAGQINSSTQFFTRKLSDSKIAVYSSLADANNPPTTVNTSNSSVAPSVSSLQFLLNAQTSPIKFKVGQGVSVLSVGKPVGSTTFMSGSVVSYTESGGTKTLVVNVTKVSGDTTTYNSWQITSDFAYGLIRPQDLGYGPLYFAVKGTAQAVVFGGNRLTPESINYLAQDQIVKFRAGSGSQLPAGISPTLNYKIKINENDVDVYTTQGSPVQITGFQLGVMEMVIAETFSIAPTELIECEDYLFSDGSGVALTPLDSTYELPYTPSPESNYRLSRAGKNQFKLKRSSISSLAIIYGGTGYTSNPSVNIVSEMGSGATATATVSGPINRIDITNGGQNYSGTIPPIVTITGGSGTGATATAEVYAGAVTGITITSGGSGYTLPLTVTITPASGQSGSGATAVAFLNGSVTSLTLTNSGSGYVQEPTIVFSGGGGVGAAARADFGGFLKWFSTGTSPDLDFFVSSQEKPILVKNIEHIEKPKTSGFISLYAADFGRSNDLTLIGQYHPTETNPKYRRIRLGKKCAWARILYQPKAPRFESPLDYIPVENARAVIAAVHAVDLEDKDFLDQAQRYWQLATTYLRAQSESLDGHAMQTPQINNITFGDGTDPVMF